MKSREEFKESIYRKRDLYLARRKQRRKAAVFVSSSAACLVLIVALSARLVVPEHNTKDAGARAPQTESRSGVYKALVRLWDENEVKAYKSEEKVNTLVEYIDKIKMEMPLTGEGSGNIHEENEEKIIVEIIFESNETRKYVIGNGIIVVDDNVYYISNRDFEGLIELIGSMESDG
ncbi:MAG: hypothetical protein GX166_13550 [Clostridiaceae bacterium]|nr:hypothetical protein [Clostridiaceae bacterium]